MKKTNSLYSKILGSWKKFWEYILFHDLDKKKTPESWCGTDARYTIYVRAAIGPNFFHGKKQLFGQLPRAYDVGMMNCRWNTHPFPTVKLRHPELFFDGWFFSFQSKMRSVEDLFEIWKKSKEMNYRRAELFLLQWVRVLVGLSRRRF